MSHYDVIIDANCEPDITWPLLYPGDTMTFASSGEHVVFCIDSAELFGSDRYDIPPDGEITLTVQNDAPNVFYKFRFTCGDPETLCPDWGNEATGGNGPKVAP